MPPFLDPDTSVSAYASQAPAKTNHAALSIRYYLSERFRLRFEDAGLDEMMDEDFSPSNPTSNPDAIDPEFNDVIPTADFDALDDEGIDVSSGSPAKSGGEQGRLCAPDMEVQALLESGAVRTLDGEVAGDEFAQDAINYQILLGKIDGLLERLKLDA